MELVLGCRRSDPQERPQAEVCEHKGIGHPDSLCDGAAEAVSRALCRAYLQAGGQVQHYNVDKALLVGGESQPRFGGGQLRQRMRLILCGRATAIPGVDLQALVCGAARQYLMDVVPQYAECFDLESAVRAGSPNLRRVIGGPATVPRANDTAFGAGFAPYSPLEALVLRVAALLRSEPWRAAFAAAGTDYKVMGLRIGERLSLTIAIAFVDRAIAGVAAYFELKRRMVRYLKAALAFRGSLVINALDDPKARDESGLYLTVTGLSAEQGDDGQVGRGNRVNGLITPGRTMSLEAAAGKNSVVHVGKLYNLLAHRIAHGIADRCAGLSEVSVQLLSTIGRPVDAPRLIAIELACEDRARRAAVDRARRIARAQLRAIPQLTADLLAGRVAVF